ncbi:glycerol-3-phosphate dehydrogenase [Ceratobasidium sp. 395]|nr:glycerol-3-phosphate dehydrogenase [Ceratobasidium sp. 395]
MGKEKVCVIGSGNWGSAIARIAGTNVKEHSDIFEEEVTMYVHEEEVDGQPLSALINEKHENIKYLPGVELGSNVRAEPDIVKAIKDATALVIVVPHQFIGSTLEQMRGHVSPQARAVSLIKGLKAEGSNILTFPSVISSTLEICCSALGGANIAKEGTHYLPDISEQRGLIVRTLSTVGRDMFCESTLGYRPMLQTKVQQIQSFGSSFSRRPNSGSAWSRTWKESVSAVVSRPLLLGFLMDWDGDRILKVRHDARGLYAELTLELLAAIIRIGLMEIKDFCLHFFPSTQADTFLQESCGVADLITSCISGRNRMIGEEMAKTGKGYQELEKEKLNGQQLEGPRTANQLHDFMVARGDEVRGRGGYQLLENVWKICFQGVSPDKVLEGL